MAQLTQKYLDKKLGSLATKDDIKPLATKVDLEEQTEDLAGIINTGFQAEHDYMERRFDELRDLLKLRDVVAEHERKFQKIAEALHIKF